MAKLPRDWSELKSRLKNDLSESSFRNEIEVLESIRQCPHCGDYLDIDGVCSNCGYEEQDL